MPVDKLKLSQSLRKLEKELQTANKLSGFRKELENSLKEVFSNADFLEQQSDQDSLFTAHFKEIADCRKLIAEFKKLECEISELSKLLNEIEPARVRADLFFENFRDCRTYYFQEAGKTLEFVGKAFENFALEKAFFKTQFAGTANLGDALQKFELQKEANQSFRVKAGKLPEFLQYALEKNFLRKSRLDNESLRILFNTSNEVFIEAENAKIRTLDRLAKELDGECWES